MTNGTGRTGIAASTVNRGSTLEEEEIMSYILGIAVVLMVAGAICLVAGIGAAGLWIAAIAVGIALVIVERVRGSHSLS